MDRRTIEKLRSHGAQSSEAWRARRITTSLLFESDSRSYLWVTQRRRTA